MSTPSGEEKETRVLIVEDNPGDARLIVEMLAEAGSGRFAVEQADRLASALDQAARTVFDVILLDLGLPDSQGLETFVSARRNRPDQPIVIISGSDDECLALNAVRSGAQDYLVKGKIDATLLKRVIRYAIERGRAEGELRDREGRFRQLTENMHEVFFVVDAQFRETIYISPAYEEVWGRTCQSVYDDPRSFIHPIPTEDQERLFASMARTQRGESPEEVEFRVARPDGTTRWILARSVPVRNEQGAVYRIAGVALDITERKKADESLAQRARMAELSADIAAALAQGTSLRDMLQRCAEGLVRHLEAAFARIWTLNDLTNVLELQASAGLYTHLDGPHSRVPVGQFKIGLIAQERQPHLTNSVIGDPRVHDQEWAQREGMVAFAGFPLIVQDQVVGVMAMFARHPLGGFVQGALATIADGMAVAIARNNAEAAQRGEYELLQSVIEGTDDAIFVKDVQGRYVLINSAEARALGRTKEAVIGRDVDSLYPPDVALGIRGGDERVMRDNAPLTEEVSIPRTDGQRTYLVSRAPHHDATGRVTGVIGVAKDITDRKRAEDVIRQLTLAVEQSPAGVVVTDTAGSIEYVNPKFTELTGFSRAEAIGKNPRILRSGQTPHEVYQELWKQITAGEEWRGVLQNRRKDGTLWWNAATISPIRDAERRITHFLAIQQDITGQRQLEDQLRQAQKMEAVGRLAGGVAHDFNNLLTVISSYSELLIQDLPEGDAARRADLGEIKKAAGDAAALTRQLLAFSRQTVVECKILDLNAMVSGAGKMLQRVIGEDISLSLVLAQELGYVKADPGQIDQVIMNLAVNARDAMPQGGKLTIETANVELDATYVQAHSVAEPGNYVQFVVTDTGVGMTEEISRHIFEPFFTTKEQGQGTGLGLATVYGIVKQFHGFIWVYSEPGQGTTFKIYLPRVEEAQDHRPQAAPPPARGTETVMLVEDAALVRNVTRQILERYGYTVLDVPHSRAALDIAARHRGPIHLLVTDVVMPEISGRQVADQVTAQRPETKVLYVSGYTDDSVVRHGVLEAEINYLQKPFSPEALARKVREVLDGKAPTP